MAVGGVAAARTAVPPRPEIGFLASRPFEIATVLALVASALLVRFPNLWSLPIETDEWQEVLPALRLVQGQGVPLTNFDAYYGAAWNYLLAGAFLLAGPDLRVPRFVVFVLGTLTIVPVYLLGRELGGRVAGLVSGLLMVTSPIHVLVNSHIGWSHSTTPLFATIALWLLVRAVRRRNSATLALAALPFGIAFQTHPTALALLPGALVYLWLRGRSLLRPSVLALACGLFLLGSANFVWAIVRAPTYTYDAVAAVQRHYQCGGTSPLACYAHNLAMAALNVTRSASGDVPETADGLIIATRPLTWLFAIALVGATVGAARLRQPFALLLVPSALVLLAFFTPGSYMAVPDARYVMPLLPSLYASLGMVLVRARVRRLPRALAAALAALLVAIPVFGINGYYASHEHEGQVATALLDTWRLLQRQYEAGTDVYVDEDILEITGFRPYGIYNSLGLLGLTGLRVRLGPLPVAERRMPGEVYVLSCRSYRMAGGDMHFAALDGQPQPCRFVVAAVAR